MANYIERSGLKEDLCCPLCLDLFLRPRSLPCSHSFCHLCLVKCAENTLVNEKFCCPVCKEDTKVDTDKIARAVIWVTRFPVNYDLLVLAQKERKENDKIKITESDEIMVTTKSDRNILYDCVEITANDEPYQSETWENNLSTKGTEDTEKVTLTKKDKIGQKGASQKKDKGYEIFSVTTSSGNNKTVFSNDCVPCLRNEENQAASVYCLECREMMCGTCKWYHLTNRFSSHHKLIEVNEELLDSNKMEFVSTITKCTHHKQNEVRYLCTDHDHPCCIECAMVTHRKCNEIVSLKDCKVSAENLQCLEKSMDEEMEYMKSLKEYHLNRKFATYESEKIIESKLLIIKEQFDFAYKNICRKHNGRT